MARPRDWYDMSYEQQQDWKKSDRKRQYVEDDLVRAKEDGERRARDAAREAEQARAEETLESSMRSSNDLTMTANGMWDTRSERNIHTIADMFDSLKCLDQMNMEEMRPKRGYMP